MRKFYGKHRSILTGLIILLFLFLRFELFAQSPVILRDSPKYEEANSHFLKMGNKALVSYYSQYHNNNTNTHISFTTQLLIDQNGIIKKTVIIDSNNYTGFGVSLPVHLKKNNKIYQFGGLNSNDASTFNFLIRTIDTNLTFVHDTIYSFNNGIVNITDAIIDSNDILVCGATKIAQKDYIFVLRINDSLQIKDSLMIPVYSSLYFESAFIKIPNKDLQIRISSRDFKADIVYEINRNPLTIKDTLYAMTGTAWYIPNSYPLFLNDSSYFTSISCGGGVAGLRLMIAWIKWNQNAEIIDTLLPMNFLADTNYVGLYKTMELVNSDSMVIAFAHNDFHHGIPSDSTSIGVMYTNIEGSNYHIIYLGKGFNYTLENIIRFNNGNVLVMASRRLYNGSFPCSSTGFVAWLLDNNGNVIQSIMSPNSRLVYGIKVFPNPTSQSVNIELYANSQSIKEYHIFDLQGKLVLQKQIDAKQYKIDVQSLARGVYIIEGVTNTGAPFGSRFVKE